LNQNKILQGIQHVFDQYLKIDTPIAPEMDLLADLQLDSMELTTLVVELENHFLVMLEESNELNVHTIEDLIHLIDHCLTEQHGVSNE
jgi:acyl carrier protein